MDARHVDQLAKALATPGVRRTLLHVLTALPLIAGLVGWGDVGEAKRRKRRKKRRKKKCKPKSLAKTCAGKCGPVRNNCKKTVDCGPCACDPPCPVCRVCDEVVGTCIPDPNQQGDDCGEPGQRCQVNGSCACDATSCAPCAACKIDGFCSASCNGFGCCDSTETCQLGTSNGACGADGETCDICSGPEQCVNQTCFCEPDCAGKCGGVSDGCGGTCTACGSGQICVGQACVTGQGTCAVDDDFCTNNARTCNGGGCQCRITTEGDTRCGGNAPGGGLPATCGECDSSADCATLYPGVIGAFCMAGGTGCCNGTAPAGNCVAPCPF